MKTLLIVLCWIGLVVVGIALTLGFYYLLAAGLIWVLRELSIVDWSGKEGIVTVGLLILSAIFGALSRRK